MNYEEKISLALTGDFSKDAAGKRLRAARKAANLSQEGLGKAAGVTKAAISNAENGTSFPSRDVMIYLFREHRIDLNFMVCGEFAQLPGDVQESLFFALYPEANEPGRSGS